MFFTLRLWPEKSWGKKSPDLAAYFNPFWAKAIGKVILTAMSSAFPDEYQEFMKKLRIAREEAGLTQMAVARRLKRNQTFVSKIELGERRVDPVELRHLAEIYGKPISFFI